MDLQFKSVKLFSLIVREYLRRYNFIPILLILSLLLLLLFFKTGILSLQQKSISEGIVGTYQRHDLPEGVTRLLSSGLMEFDQKGRVVPKLAESWEVNEESKEFKFKLKKDLRWTDGSPLKSTDLEFAIPDVETSFPDETSILFKLKDSFPPFPSLLVKPVFKKGGALVGIGPYQLKKLETSRIFITKMILVPTEASLPPISIRFYPNEKTASVALQLGEVQSLLGVTNHGPYRGPKLKFKQKITYTRLVSIIYNTKDPILSSRSIRQALSFSAPEIEGEMVAKTPFPPNSWVYSEENIKDYLSNKKEAQEALARIQSSSAELLKKEIILTSTPQLESVGRKVVAAWQELGLSAKLRVESGIPQNFQALLITQTIPQDPDQYSLWHSTQVQTNLSKYSSPRADKDLEDGRKERGEEERKTKYLDFQRVLMEDAPAAFLYFPQYTIIYLEKIEKVLNRVLPLQLPY